MKPDVDRKFLFFGLGVASRRNVPHHSRRCARIEPIFLE